MKICYLFTRQYILYPLCNTVNHDHELSSLINTKFNANYMPWTISERNSVFLGYFMWKSVDYIHHWNLQIFRNFEFFVISNSWLASSISNQKRKSGIVQCHTPNNVFTWSHSDHFVVCKWVLDTLFQADRVGNSVLWTNTLNKKFSFALLVQYPSIKATRDNDESKITADYEW